MKTRWIVIPGLGVIILALLVKFVEPEVGGPCTYRDHPGIAEVIAVGDEYRFRFHLSETPPVGLNGDAFDWARLDGEEFSWRRSGFAGAAIGDRYHATLSVEVEGSCTPFGFDIGEPVKSEK